MRPRSLSFLRYPLSTLLGTETSVRILRELALHGKELSTTTISQRTGISDQSVRNAIRALLPTGVLMFYGQGRAVSYRLDVEHPIGEALRDLFRAEGARMEEIRETVASAARQMEPHPLAVWLFGSVARGEDGPSSDIDLLFVADDDTTVEHAASVFRERLEDLEREQQITLSVIPLSGTDIQRLAGANDPFWKEILRDAIPWHGKRPQDLLTSLRRKPNGALVGKENASG